MLDRATNRIAAAVVPATTSAVLCPFVEERTSGGALVYSDEAYAYTKVLRPYQAIAHARGEYARGDVSTNGIESFWALLKRGYRGTYHSWSPKHLDRYGREFSGRHNARPLDLLDRMGAMAGGLDGRRLRYVKLARALPMNSAPTTAMPTIVKTKTRAVVIVC